MCVCVCVCVCASQAYTDLDGGGMAEGLLVMSVADYLACCWPSLSDLADLYDSLSASLSSNNTTC